MTPVSSTHRTFTGKEAVLWISGHGYAPSETDARTKFQDIVEAGLVEQMSAKKKKKSKAASYRWVTPAKWETLFSTKGERRLSSTTPSLFKLFKAPALCLRSACR